MEPIRNLSWLHFSDLSIRPEFMLQRHAIGLLEEIGRLVEKYGPPDFIAVSGGVAARGQPDEYAAARQFFEEALEAAGLSSDRLFITPGESDAPHGRLDNFQAFLASLGQPATPGDARMHCFDTGSLPVSVCSLEAAPQPGGLLGHMAPQAAQALNLTLAQPREATLRFLLTHLSPQQMLTASGELALTPEASDFILFTRGSLQAPARVAQWGSCLLIQGGAYAGETLRPNAFNLARLDFSARLGELHFRRYDSAAGGWLPELSGAAPDGVYRFMLEEALVARLDGPAAPAAAPVWPDPGLTAAATQVVERTAAPPPAWPPADFQPHPVGSAELAAAAVHPAAPGGDGSGGDGPMPAVVPAAPADAAGPLAELPAPPEPAGLLGASLPGWGAAETVLPARLVSDLPAGQDCLNFTPEAAAVAQFLVARQTQAPLAIGIFGGPGSGKTFFLNLVRDNVSRLAGDAGMSVVQAAFNPWLDSDADPWSALAASLYQSLDAGTAPQQRAGLRRQAAATLQEVEHARQQAQAERDSAAFYLEQVEAQLQEARRQREQAVARQQDLLSGLTLASLLPFNRHKELVGLCSQLGFPAAFETIEQLSDALESLKPPARRLRLALRTSRGQRLGLALGLMLLVLTAVLAYVIYRGLSGIGALPELLSGAITVTLYVASLLMSGVVLGWALLGQIQPEIKQLATLLDEARRNYALRRRTLANRETQIQEETAQANEREQSARNALSAAQARLAQAEAALKQLDVAPEQTPLLEFARRRLAEEQAELGEAAELHTDLKTLAALLRSGRTGDLPLVERIIVYVDDLERCASARLESVLQALHLLLTFDTFLVVLAADPAVLQSALQQARPGLTPAAARRQLEKLVQAPFHLPRLAPAGAQAVADFTLNGRLPAPASPGAGSPGSAAGAGPAELRPGEASGSAPAAGGDGRGGASVFSGAVSGVSASPPAALRAAARPRAVETALITRLAGLLPSPRLARRLANLYSLLRAAVPPGQLERFLSDAAGPGEFRAAAALLALQLAYPEPAARLAAYLAGLRPETDLSVLAARLAPRQVAAAVDGREPRYANALQKDLEPGEALAWQDLGQALLILLAEGAVPARAAEWKAWVTLAGRLSFDGPAEPPSPGLAPDVRLAGLQPAPGPRSPNKECVRLENNGAAPQPLLGWSLGAPDQKAVFSFPALELAPGAALEVWSGEGQAGPAVLHWGRKSPAWGGAAEIWLRDADGELVSRLPVAAEDQSSG